MAKKIEAYPEMRDKGSLKRDKGDTCATPRKRETKIVSDPVNGMPKKIENATLFLQLGYPYTLIRHGKGAFQKRSLN